MNAGDKISWRTANGFANGTLVERVFPDSPTWLVNMDSGWYMLVHETSMIPNNE